MLCKGISLSVFIEIHVLFNPHLKVYKFDNKINSYHIILT